MANVLVIQRHAHLAGPVRIEYVQARGGEVAKAVLTAISNRRRGGPGEARDEATAIQWTLWGSLAESAAVYLVKGSHVNIVGRLRNDNYEKDGSTVYGMSFTAEEIDYLDSRAEGEARRDKGWDDQGGGGQATYPAAADASDARPRHEAQASNSAA